VIVYNVSVAGLTFHRLGDACSGAVFYGLETAEADGCGERGSSGPSKS
jgi:hypothetical protein